MPETSPRSRREVAGLCVKLKAGTVRVMKSVAHRFPFRFHASSVALVCVVFFSSAAAQPAVEWGPPIEVASGGGERGPWRQNQSQFHYVDDPSVALVDGAAAVVWVDNTRKEVLFQRFEPDGRPALSEPTNVSRSAKVFSWLPRVAVDPRRPQHVHVLWQEIVFSGGSHGGETFYARSTDGGQTFGRPLNLSNSREGDGKGRITESVWHNGSHDLVLDPRGVLFATWTDYEGTLWFTHSVSGGANFASPRRIAGNPAMPARAPSLAVAPDGTVLLAWSVGENPRGDIHVSRSRNRGESFDRPTLVAPGRGFADAPKLAVDPHGVVHLAYAESADGPEGMPQVFYAQSIDGGLTFRESRALANPHPVGSVGAGFPAISANGSGVVCVVWELFAKDDAAPRGLGYSISHDGGGTFSWPDVVPASADPNGINGSLQGLLMRKLALDRTGTVVVANSSFAEGQGSRVWLMRGRIDSR